MKSLLFIGVFAMLFVGPQTASAGFWSFLGIGGADEKTEVVVLNSQNMLLLEADIAHTSDQVSTTSIDDTALAPETNLLGTTEVLDTNATSDQISLYVVHAGDTVATVAKMYGVSESTIRWANDLDRNAKLKKDQVLTILPIDGVKYTIKKGDTLRSIAKNLKADATEIAQFNDMAIGDSLAVGNELIIPNGEITAPTIKSGTPSVSGMKGPNYTDYYIRPIMAGYANVRTQGAHGKNKAAVDIGAKLGTPLVASASGTVIVAKTTGYNGGYGMYVVIAHPNNTQTLYGHMSRVDVSVGQTVSQGQQIGAVGSTGNSTGPHVHWEVRNAQNPIALNARYGF